MLLKPVRITNKDLRDNLRKVVQLLRAGKISEKTSKILMNKLCIDFVDNGLYFLLKNYEDNHKKD